MIMIVSWSYHDRKYRGEYGHGKDIRREEDHDEEYHVKEDSGEIYDEDIRGKDGCDQAGDND